MTLLADLLSTLFERRQRWVAPVGQDDRSLEELAEELVSATGEASGVAIGAEILSRFDALGDEDKLRFFCHVALAMDIDPKVVRTHLDAYEANPSEQSYKGFASSAEPRRQELIRRLNQVPGATSRLVRMRADLLRLATAQPKLSELDIDFRHLFASWFNRGFLVLRPISWESPAHILEKIIAYEAVHEISSWDDLRRRLEPSDRRCFAFFHPSMPDEPLIFVEVALTKGTPQSIQTLLADDREPMPVGMADTAVFYSISNCQPGLARISFGKSLIKQVASDLSAELGGIATFVTLSPIPGLVGWLKRQGYAIPQINSAEMRSLASYYLLHAKNNAGLPADPVARFHLGNGATVFAVHSDADKSERGLLQSGGAMVNYLYNLETVTQNHERFATTLEVISSTEVKNYASAVTQVKA